MPGNFARSGPVLGFFATAFMAFANIFASVAMSKVLLLAWTSVKTLVTSANPSSTHWVFDSLSLRYDADIVLPDVQRQHREPIRMPLNPASYIAERLALGMHRTSVVATSAESQPNNDHDTEVTEYRGANAVKYIVLRVAIVIVLAVFSIILAPSDSDSTFPYCEPEYQNTIYYNQTA
ncbi:Amino acid/auxin permease-like protein [Phytophthora palmivora]|uniref:Amino acid/auxin permease-like protein n=1 Tax=Phytophthora palmivora TaxID=4796 RepID=A0A2P4X8I6_9STRA|nr:Amino acid/auxin permease-like protein [Phytophthora palmivora]